MSVRNLVGSIQDSMRLDVGVDGDPHERADGTNDLMNAQIRTVFVVHTTTLHKLLNWASDHLINLS